MAVECKGEKLEPLEEELGEDFTMQKVLNLNFPELDSSNSDGSILRAFNCKYN